MARRPPSGNTAIPVLADDEWPLPLDCPNVVTFDEVLGPPQAAATSESTDGDGEARGGS